MANDTKQQESKKTIVDVILSVNCNILETLKNLSYLKAQKNFKLDKQQLDKATNEAQFFGVLVSLVTAENLETSDDIQFSWSDKLGIALISFGIAHLIGFATMKKQLESEGVETEGVIHRFNSIIREDFDMTLVISRLIQKATSNVHKFIKFRNLLGFGMLSIFGAGIIFLDAGMALLSRNETFNDTLAKTYREAIRQRLLDCLNKIVNDSKNIDSVIGSFLAKTFSAIQFVFGKIKALIDSIINFFRSKPKQESLLYLHESIMDSLLVRILLRILKLVGVTTIIVVAIVVIARMAGITRQQLIEKSGPLSSFFRKVFEIYDSTIDPVINKVFGRQSGSKEGGEEQKEEKKPEQTTERPEEGTQ